MTAVFQAWITLWMVVTLKRMESTWGRTSLGVKGTVQFLSMRCQPVAHSGAEVQKLVRNIHRREIQAGGYAAIYI